MVCGDCYTCSAEVYPWSAGIVTHALQRCTHGLRGLLHMLCRGVPMLRGDCYTCSAEVYPCSAGVVTHALQRCTHAPQGLLYMLCRGVPMLRRGCYTCPAEVFPCSIGVLHMLCRARGTQLSSWSAFEMFQGYSRKESVWFHV